MHRCSKSSRVIISTNATLLDTNISNELISSGLDDIVFSLDANSEETYNKIKKFSDYNQTLKNIKNFIKINKDNGSKTKITLKLIALDANKNEIDSFVSEWRNHSCKVEISPLRTWANQIESQNSSNSIYPLDGQVLPCAELWFKCTITYKGKVILCCQDFKETEILGDLNKQNLKEIWNSDQINKLRESHIKNSLKRPGLCKACKESTCIEEVFNLFPEFSSMRIGGRP